MTDNFAEYLQLAVLVVGLVSYGLMMLNRYAVANHNDRLARITSAAGNVAGDIRDQLNGLPPGVDYATAKADLINKAMPAFEKEFADSGTKVSATPDKLRGIVVGQLGQIPPAAATTTAATTAVAVARAAQTITDARTALSSLDPPRVSSAASAPLPVPLPAPQAPPVLLPVAPDPLLAA